MRAVLILCFVNYQQAVGCLAARGGAGVGTDEGDGRFAEYAAEGTGLTLPTAAIPGIVEPLFQATKTTIRRDLARAVWLLKSMPTEDERQRAAVYMDGLSQMRSEWAVAGRAGRGRPARRRKG